MLSLNTNLSSIIAQRSLTNSSKLLNHAIECMSTGAKLNHSGDNAANYSITTNLTTKLGAYQVAEDNVAMGLDFLNTANSSLDLIANKLNRLRALAEQAANGTYGKQSLGSINTEANAIADEIERIYSTAEYNGIKLFEAETEKSSATFIEKIEQRDTSSMTKLSDVDPTKKLNGGTYSISTVEELAQLADMTNKGLVTEKTLEFVLGNNIDLSSYSSGEGWTPIGNNKNYFIGTFDGNGYVISNLYINRPDKEYQGLFNNTSGVIKNLGVESCNITGDSFVAGLVANNDSDITNCYVTGNINGTSYVGALVAYNTADNVTNSYSTANIIGSSIVGGLIGFHHGDNIINCYATGEVRSNNLKGIHGSRSSFGGLIGSVNGSGSNVVVANCYATGNVIGCMVEYDKYETLYNNIGGLIGTISNKQSIVTDCYSTGDVYVLRGRSFGGLIGDNDAQVTNCYTTGDVIVSGWIDSKLYYYALLSSDNYSTVTNSYATGSVTGITCNGPINITTEELNTLIANGLLPNQEPKPTYAPVNLNATLTEINFQVGVNASSNSLVTLSTAFSLDISNLRGIGQNNTDYLSIIDNLTNKVSAKQTEIGAAQNRLESAAEEINTHYENLLSSRSTLRDADISQVSSEYIKQQILQQASATLLATANQSPNLALQLL